MIASPHIIAGGSLGLWAYNSVKNKKVAILLGLFAGTLSHFVLDHVPHMEYPEESLVATCFLDIILAVSLAIRYGYTSDLKLSNYALFAGIVGGSLPDIPFFFVRMFDLDWGWLYSLTEINAFFHAPPYWEPKIGVVPQMILSLFFVFGIKMNKSKTRH